MLLITKRKKIGAVYGHTIYAIAKSEMLPIPNPTVQSSMAVSKDENRSFVHSACKCNKRINSAARGLGDFAFRHTCSLCNLNF